MLNLNLGSGSNRIKDYISVDLYDPAADIGLDITRRLPWDNRSVDNVYLCHVIEHLSRDEWKSLSNELRRVIKKGGQIEIRCPDIIKSCEKFLQDPTDPFNMQILYGIQTTPGEFHKNGFTKESLMSYFQEFQAELMSPSSDYELHMRFTL
jgi:predicted SAM-dependent methyltransferase